MKINTIQTLVAHVTINGLESLDFGHINNVNTLLDGNPGSLLMEIASEPQIAAQMQIDVQMALCVHGREYALMILDKYLLGPWGVTINEVTTGNAKCDRQLQNAALAQGRFLKVSTSKK